MNTYNYYLKNYSLSKYIFTLILVLVFYFIPMRFYFAIMLRSLFSSSFKIIKGLFYGFEQKFNFDVGLQQVQNTILCTELSDVSHF